MNVRFYRLGNKVAAEFDERPRIYLTSFQSKSAQALEAKKEKVLTHEAAEEFHR